jgi:SAM-dependent methyltransferase
VTRRALDRFNAALARRYPDPLPAALDRFYSPQRPGMLLFDFGCGSEAFLNHARARGWDTLGADFAPGAVEAARRAGHRALAVGPGLWGQIPDGSVDAVRMNHVVEHLYRPHEVLAALRRALRPGGRLHLATPNAACLTFRLLRQRWFSLDCPRHIVLYSPATIRAALARAGFARVAVYQEVLTKDMARSLGYVLQDLGRLDGAGVTGLADRPGLAALLFATARVAALTGVADRLHVIAEA